MQAEPVLERVDWAAFDEWLLAIRLDVELRLAQLADEIAKRTSPVQEKQKDE